jgi:hypothetical protein
LEKCIALYYRSQVSPSDVSAEPEPQQQKVGVDGSPLGSHGYPLRPNGEPCAIYGKCGKCDYGEECRYDHPEEILAELLQAQAPIPPPPPTDDEDEEEALILDDSADETPPPTENAADSQAVYCEDCEMWLNGPTQWEDHKIGKKHKKNLKRNKGANAAGNARAKAHPEKKMQPTIASEPLPDMQPQGYMGMPEQHPEERVPPTDASEMGMSEEMQWPTDYQQIEWSAEAACPWYAAVWQEAAPAWMGGDPWQQYQADVAHVRMSSWH